MDQEQKLYTQTNNEKIYSRFDFAIAALFGGPLVVGLLSSENYKVFGEYKTAKQVKILGIILTIFLLGLGWFLAHKGIDGHHLSFGLLISIIMIGLQSKKNKEYIKNGGKTGKRWPISAIVITIIMIILSIVSIVSNIRAKLDPDLADIASYVQKVQTEILQGNYNAALIEVEQAIEVAEKSKLAKDKLAALYGARGDIKLAMKNFDSAIVDYQTALEIYPSAKFAYTGLASANQNKGNITDAISFLEKAIELDLNNTNRPKNEEILASVGLLYNQLKIHDKVVEVNTRIIEISPNNMNAFANRGFAYMNLKQPTLAILDFNQALTLNPHYDNVYLARAGAEASLNQPTEACKDLHSVSTVPTDPFYLSEYERLTTWCKQFGF